MAFILLQSPGLWQTAHICYFLQRATLYLSSPGHATLPSSSAGKLIQETLVPSFLGFCKVGSSMLSALQAECEGLSYVSA